MLPIDDGGQPVPYGYSYEDFLVDALKRLPELADDADLHFYRGRLDVSDLARLARRAIPARDHDFLGRLFGLVNDAVTRPNADPEIANAVEISFLRMADFMLPHGNEAWRLVPSELRWYVKGCN